MDGSHRNQFSATAVSIIYLILIGLIGGGVWYWWQPAAESAPVVADVFPSLKTASSPTTSGDNLDINRSLSQRMTSQQATELALNEQLRDLGYFIRDKVNGKNGRQPAWIGPSFVGLGIDPTKFTQRLDDRTTTVQRYLQSPSAPQFSGKRSFEKFIANSMSRVENCRRSEITLRLETIRPLDSKFEATILAEAYGARAQTKKEWEQTGKTKRVIQQTSVWRTVWAPMNNDDKVYQLRRAEIVASENVSLSLASERLFFDCTESIFKNCDCLNEQLIFGLDEWAAKLPGIDVSGRQGLAVEDVNGDGMDDIYICQPRGLPNLLLFQRRDGTVVDHSMASNTNLLDDSRGTLLVDIDNDGDNDLVVATDQALVLMSNSGTGEFQIERKLDFARRGLSIAAADYDNDGDLDLFVCREPESKQDLARPPGLELGSILLRNEEAFRFDLVELDDVNDAQPLFSRSAIWIDRDSDGDQDLCIASEQLGEIIYTNQNGTLVRQSAGPQAASRAARSVGAGDFNGDGRSDLFVAAGSIDNQAESYVRHGGLAESVPPFFLRKPLFSNELANTTVVGDFNNDGRDDLLIGNGGFTRVATKDSAPLIQDVDDFERAVKGRLSLNSRQTNRCFFSIGRLGFAEASGGSGLNVAEDARAMVTTDWDDDGDLDVLVLSRSRPQLRIFINVLSSRGSSVSFRLSDRRNHRSVIGSRVELFFEGQSNPLVKTLQAGTGCLGQSSSKLIFGVGQGRKVDFARVHWSAGDYQEFTKLAVGSNYQINRGDAAPVEKIKNRFRLKIRGSKMIGRSKIPNADRRVRLDRPTVLPTLEVQVDQANWAPLPLAGLSQPPRSQLILFWGQNPASENALETCNRIAEGLRAENTDLVAVLVDNENFRSEEIWSYMDSFREKQNSISVWWSLAEAGKQQLAIFCGHLFNRYELPRRPFAMLVNPQGRLESIYPAESIRSKQIFSDVRRHQDAELLDEVSVAPAGRWASPSSSIPVDPLWDDWRRSGFTDAGSVVNEDLRNQRTEQLVLQANDMLVRQRFDFAHALSREALQRDPDNTKAIILQADLIVQKTLANTKSLPLSASPELEAADRNYQKTLALDPQVWQAVIGRAKLALMTGNPDQALAMLDQYLKQHSPRAEIQSLYGRICFQLGRLDRAKRYLNLAYDQRPKLPHLAGDLGYLYLISGEEDRGRKLLRIANQYQPSDRTVLRLLAEVEFKKGNFQRATDLYQQVCRLEPGQSAKNVLAWLLATSPYDSKRNGAAALELISLDSTDLAEQSPQTLEVYAACFAELSNFKRAVQIQQQAVDKVDAEPNTSYSQSQIKGMLWRMELYRSQQPYRTADTSQTPFIESTTADQTFNALRF